MSLQDDPLIRSLLKLVANLGLDRGDFVIFGSGPLLAHELLGEISDLDVVVRPAVWQRVVDYADLHGELMKGVHNEATIAQFRDGDSCIQFSSGWISNEWDADGLIADADEFKADDFEGLRFARLDDVLTYKEVLGRSKDSKHIEILRSHLGK